MNEIIEQFLARGFKTSYFGDVLFIYNMDYCLMCRESACKTQWIFHVSWPTSDLAPVIFMPDYKRRKELGAFPKTKPVTEIADTICTAIADMPSLYAEQLAEQALHDRKMRHDIDAFAGIAGRMNVDVDDRTFEGRLTQFIPWLSIRNGTARMELEIDADLAALVAAMVHGYTKEVKQ